MATYKKQLRDKDNNIIYPAQGLGTITNENIDWTTFSSIEWTRVSLSNGYVNSVNAAFFQGLRIAIVGAFLVVEVGVSRSGGATMEKGTEYNFAELPSTFKGVNLYNLFDESNHLGFRTFCSGLGTSIGVFGISSINGQIKCYIKPSTDNATWAYSFAMIPLCRVNIGS